MKITDNHHRHSIRLKGYDYSQEGLYFVTICTQNRQYLFGKIVNREMILNDPGIMAVKWWNKLKQKYRNIELHEKIIMPNHFHGIIQITNKSDNLGEIIKWFKTMTTNEYIRGVNNNNWQPFAGKLWQRNYWEHIIRNENEYNGIAQYIVDNPTKWENDKLNGGNGNIVIEPIVEYNTEIWMI